MLGEVYLVMGGVTNDLLLQRWKVICVPISFNTSNCLFSQGIGKMLTYWAHPSFLNY